MENEAVDLFLRQLKEDVAQDLQNLKRAQEKQKKYTDKRRRELDIQEGDEVLLSTKNLPIMVAVGGRHKLGPLYCGPFTILEKLIGAYKLEGTPCIPCFPIEIVQETRRPDQNLPKA